MQKKSDDIMEKKVELVEALIIAAIKKITVLLLNKAEWKMQFSLLSVRNWKKKKRFKTFENFLHNKEKSIYLWHGN